MANLWVAVLTDRKVVLAGAEEGGGGVDGAFVKDGVNTDNKEVGERCKKGLIGYQRGWRGLRRHFPALVCKLFKKICRGTLMTTTTGMVVILISALRRAIT